MVDRLGTIHGRAPEAVVGAFLRAAQAGNWGTAQAYMTRHMQGRLAREGFGAMRGFLATRLEPFATFEIIQVTPRGDESDVVVRLNVGRGASTSSRKWTPESDKETVATGGSPCTRQTNMRTASGRLCS